VQRIDLRSDTVTLPSPAMRQAMAEAPVGDDQYGEDPSVIALQARAAELLGKPTALFLPSGTMTNQVALKLLTQPGDDVIAPTEAHIVFHETGASAANSGVQFTQVGEGGLFGPDDVRQAFKPHGHIIYPPSTLLVVENTHNRGGGVVLGRAEGEAIAATARELGMKAYLDGARLLNAATALGESAAALAGPFDLVSLSLSKGLGAPVGSVLAGDKALIDAGVRVRRRFGGAMRQAGIIAAGGLYALEHNAGRLGEDHANARAIAETLAPHRHVALDLSTVQTNIIVLRTKPPGPSAPAVAEACRAEGVLISAFTDRMLRVVTHLDVDTAACAQAAEVILKALG
jgi:threonine aldolase